MAQTVTASAGITDGQIDNAVDKFRSALRKHRGDFGSDAVQQVLGVDNLGMELLTPFRKRVEAVSSMIVRHTKVNRSRFSQVVLDNTGRKQYVDSRVVGPMPRGYGEEVDVHFFKFDRFVSDDELDKEYELRGLKAADPYSLAAVNTDDPAFADEHPNGTHWKDADGNWCFAAFSRWGGERHVNVSRRGNDWGVRWWFAGVRK